jgi:hypothetical protein
LSDGFEAVGLEPVQNEFADGFFLAGRAGNASEIAAELGQLIAINLS